MKVIIAGSRDLADMATVERAVEQAYETRGIAISQVVSGNARGVDKLGEQWADKRKIPVAVFPADWNKFGNSAGVRRNVEMAQYADALIAVWDGKSRGTKHMIEVASHADLLVYVLNTAKETPQ